MIHHSNLLHHFIVCSVSSSMWLSLIVCCVFHWERTSETGPATVPASQIPVESMLELLGSRNESIVVHQSSVQRHHSSLLRHPPVLHRSLATILGHVIMLLYSFTSSNNLATDANTPCRLFNCIVEISVLCDCCLQNISPPVYAFILLS